MCKGNCPREIIKCLIVFEKVINYSNDATTRQGFMLSLWCAKHEFGVGEDVTNLTAVYVTRPCADMSLFEMNLYFVYSFIDLKIYKQTHSTVTSKRNDMGNK